MKYGLVEAKTSDLVGKVRILLEGVDVTDFCTAANDIEGWVDLLSPPAAIPRMSGNVVIEKA